MPSRNGLGEPLSIEDADLGEASEATRLEATRSEAATSASPSDEPTEIGQPLGKPTGPSGLAQLIVLPSDETLGVCGPDGVCY